MSKMRKLMANRRSGQTMTEYIIIVVIVAVAALIIFGIFSDTIRTKLAGTVSSIDSGTHASDAQSEVATKSVDILKNLNEQGIDSSGGSGS
ncbi:MAG: hypothetical protein HZA91_05520 [Verrucomicrobia bacterium]|nr:hypothetical protein [Verrucomicrobiota bacterium]